jgi:hypothetical protein
MQGRGRAEKQESPGTNRASKRQQASGLVILGLSFTKAIIVTATLTTGPMCVLRDRLQGEIGICTGSRSQGLDEQKG